MELKELHTLSNLIQSSFDLNLTENLITNLQRSRHITGVFYFVDSICKENIVTAEEKGNVIVESYRFLTALFGERFNC